MPCLRVRKLKTRIAVMTVYILRYQEERATTGAPIEHCLDRIIPISYCQLYGTTGFRSIQVTHALIPPKVFLRIMTLYFASFMKEVAWKGIYFYIYVFFLLNPLLLFQYATRKRNYSFYFSFTFIMVNVLTNVFVMFLLHAVEYLFTQLCYPELLENN